VSADDSEIRGDDAAARQELQVMRDRMERLRKEAAIEVEANWQTQWKNPDVFALKVQTRLTMNEEYRTLQDKVRAAEATLEPKQASSGGGGMSLSDW
jgi:predicted DsbA family dithiol-disulfide isomerase